MGMRWMILFVVTQARIGVMTQTTRGLLVFLYGANLGMGPLSFRSWSAPREAVPPSVLLLDHLEESFAPDGRRCTHPATITADGAMSGGRPSKGTRFVPGKTGSCLEFSGMSWLDYPVTGNLSLSAGSLSFRTAFNFDAAAARKKGTSEMRNQLFLTIRGKGRTRLSIYSTLVNTCVGVWDASGQLVCYGGFGGYWKQDEWHRVELRWGRSLELWCDGVRRVAKEDWQTLFGPLDVKPADLRLRFGSQQGYSNVYSEFKLDEIRILGPGGGLPPPYPILTVPRIRAPRIDGVLDKAEWANAARTTGFFELRAPVLAEDQTAVYAGWDEEALYIAFSCTDPRKRPITAMLKDRDSAVFMEDAVDIFLAPGPGVFPYYQLVANAIATRYDSRVDPAGAARHDTTFNPDWTVACSRRDGTWTLEARIPFAELDGRSPPEDGERWRVNFCRDADAASRLSSWAFMDADFHRFSHFGEIVFSTRERTIRLDALQGWREGRMNARLSMTATSFLPLHTVRSRLVDAAARTIAESENRLADYRTVSIDSPRLVTGLYTLTLRASSPTGDLYVQRLPFRVSKPYDISVANYPYEGKLWVTANIGGLGSRCTRVRVRLVDKTGAPAGRCEVRDFTRGLGRAAMATDTLPHGEYGILSEALDAQATVLAKAEADVRLQRKPPWWRSPAGVDHTVPVPWTPVTTGADEVRTWGRVYRGTGCLPQQIVNQNTDMLAAPMRLRIAAGSAAADLASVPLRVTETKPDVVIRQGELRIGEVMVSLRTRTEFDGMQRCDLDLVPTREGAVVSSLILEIPLREGLAPFLLSSNGRSASPRRLDGQAWRSPFLPQVWLGNDDLGFAWFAESDEGWTPRDQQMIEILPGSGKGETLLRCNIMRKPRPLDAPLRITFGFMATPVKRAPVGDPFHYRFAVPPCDIRRLDDPKAARAFMEFLTYPAPGNLDPRKGTLEFRLASAPTGDDPEREVVHVQGTGGGMALMFRPGKTQTTLKLRARNGETQRTVSAAIGPLPAGRFAHVAITWSDRIRLLAEGRELAVLPFGLPANLLDPPGKASLRFGCARDTKGFTRMLVDEVRVSSGVRYPGTSYAVPDAPFAPDDRTLLLDHLDGPFTPDGEDAETRAAVISGRSGELGGVPSIGCRFVGGVFGRALRIAIPDPVSGLDSMRAWGANSMLFWSWFESPPYSLGWPPPLFSEPKRDDYREGLKKLLDIGVRSCPYMAYTGIGAPSPLSEQFGREWARMPLSTIPAEPPAGHHFLDCCGRSGFGDYLAAGTQWLLDDLGFRGCYTDGNAHAYPCNNSHHGCGYSAADGSRRATWPIFATREYLKRMYRIIHAKDPAGFLVNHVSYNLLIPTMSFTDIFYTGEHERYEDLLKYRVLWQGKQWGVWPILLGADAHAYRPLHMTYSLLHGVSVWPQGNTGRNDMLRKTVNLWKAYDRFGYRKARWVPYYRAEQLELARADSANVKTSLYLKRGRAAMLIVGNLNHAVATARIALDLKAMELPRAVTATNLLDGRPLAVSGGLVSVRLRPTSFVLVHVRAEAR